ncbi:hypothetical protein AG1IA_00732 [Rhizoctonia solani AG-1 IA]|uniref:Uncharacterized protein n=1 Tax=Thanatephorus cucumeris (strain AG1-IA) TaxID=983506 RepID=L8X4M3_THACA|nr:hypothetical protein AG1IA_00732 [Rhizoctonia solani AG-1 IA]
MLNACKDAAFWARHSHRNFGSIRPSKGLGVGATAYNQVQSFGLDSHIKTTRSIQFLHGWPESADFLNVKNRTLHAECWQNPDQFSMNPHPQLTPVLSRCGFCWDGSASLVNIAGHRAVCFQDLPVYIIQAYMSEPAAVISSAKQASGETSEPGLQDASTTHPEDQ